MNKRSYSQLLDKAASDCLAKNTDLAPRILSQIQKGKTFTMQPRRKVFITMIAALLVLAVLTVNIPNVKAALQRWVGYVPETGLVSDGEIRVLAEPVSLTQDGITLTVKQMTTTSDQTIVQYSVEGLDRNQSGAGGCDQEAVLLYSGNELGVLQPPVMVGGETGFEVKGVYPAVPAEVNEIRFVMPCVLQGTSGNVAQGWDLALNLVAAPADMTILPVIENVDASAANQPAQSAVEPALSADGMFLAIDRAVQMDDGLLVYATIHWENTGLGWIELPDASALHLLDANGNEIAFEIDYKATNEVLSAAPAGQTSFAIKTAPVQAAGALTLALDSVAANMKSDAVFSVDLGSAPESGQTWELNQTIDLGFGQSMQVSKVTFEVKDEDYVMLGFEMNSETGVIKARLFDEAHPMAAIENNAGSGQFASNIFYKNASPSGLLGVAVKSFTVDLPGNWQTTWTMPVQ